MSILDEAFAAVQRVEFLPDEVKGRATQDMALPIGYGQTNSQPSTVYMMLTWLDAKPGHTVLDVGSGSGWTTALLGYIVGEYGMVYAVERQPELLTLGKSNCQRFGVLNARFYRAGKHYGLPRFGPYDRILVSAAAGKIPEELSHQLKIGGRMVIPVQNTILVVERTDESDYVIAEHPGFIFVPLI